MDTSKLYLPADGGQPSAKALSLRLYAWGFFMYLSRSSVTIAMILLHLEFSKNVTRSSCTSGSLVEQYMGNSQHVCCLQ